MRIVIADDACGRYTLNVKVKDIKKRYNLATIPEGYRENYNVTPRQIMPVVTEDEEGRRLEFMRWGIPRFLGKDTIKELINTKAESAFGPFWNKTVLHQRALIPATGFYEWQKTDDKKLPYLIHPKEIPIYSFAGIWSTWTDDKGKNWKVYSIMTTEPNKEMSAIHNRAPVMLHPEDEASWIKPSNVSRDSLEPLLLPFEDRGLEIYRVSDEVNSPRNNFPELLTPLKT
jgi:putative SOS response-associated peptidase YedK